MYEDMWLSKGAGMRKTALHVLLVACLWSGSAYAQDSSLQSLTYELERLRGDLNDLQRFVYKADPSELPATTGGETDNTRLLLVYQRLEAELRTLTGRVEEMEFEFSGRIDRLVADLDERLSRIEQGMVVKEKPTETGMTAEAPASTPEESEANIADTDAGGNVLPSGTVMEQFNYAFSLLRRADHDAAEIAFTEFIALNPTSELVGNAYYWLGSTHLVRERYRDAAVAFLKGYQQSPDGPKAAASLSKLGATLVKLEKVEEACATFRELHERFPDAGSVILDEANAAAAAAGCKTS